MITLSKATLLLQELCINGIRGEICIMTSKWTPVHMSLVALAITMVLPSCEQNHSGGAVGSDAAAEEMGALLWPELIAFEQIALRAKRLAEKEDREGILKQRTAILEAGWAVSPSSMPENLPNHDQLHAILGKLTGLVNGMARSDLSDERLFALASRLSPVVKELIEVSGAIPTKAKNGSH